MDYTPPPDYHYERIVKVPSPEDTFALKKRVFNSMDQLHGWCTKAKAAILIDLILMIKPATVVEIGVFGGKSLVPMAYALQHNKMGVIYGIDPWSATESAVGMDKVNEEWWSKVDHDSIYQDLVKKSALFGLEDHIELIRTTSELATSIEMIDVLHIDGNHSEKTSLFDVKKWVPLVRPGGVIIFDDISWGTTNAAVEWLNFNCIKFVEFSDSSDWGIWIKL